MIGESRGGPHVPMPEPGTRIMAATTAAEVDYNDAIRRRTDEATLRRWAIEQAKALSIVDTAEELVEAAQAIEAYVKGSE